MAKSKQDANTGEDAVALGQAIFQQFQDAGFGPTKWMGTAWFEAMADMNSELVTFVADRIREDVQAQREMLHCTSAQELQKAQVAFLEKAYAQYTDETGKLVKMGMDMLPQTVADTKDTPL